MFAVKVMSPKGFEGYFISDDRPPVLLVKEALKFDTLAEAESIASHVTETWFDCIGEAHPIN